jgi:Putative zinc-finger
MTHQEATATLATERYLLDEMTEAERDAFEAHFFACAECADDVRLGALMREGARAGFLAGTPEALAGTREAGRTGAQVLGFPGAAAPRRWYQSAVLPWAMAASLTLLAGWQSFVQVPALRRLESVPLAVVPVNLRPASRGAEPVVVVRPDASVIALAVDASSTAPGAELSYDLRSAAGASVFSGRVSAPPSGPLLLLVPARLIGAPGHYVLTAADREYRFEVTNP